MLTAERASMVVNYDPATGEFRWVAGRNSGLVAGYKNWKGYLCLRIDGKEYRAHRVAWLITFGKFPVGEIDHRNRIKDDNRIENLREATSSQNHANVDVHVGSCGFRGVTRDKRCSKYSARVRKDSKTINLGYFDNRETAARIAADARQRLFGSFAV